jgi:MFS superfamily sulfate permease-like transporter
LAGLATAGTAPYVSLAGLVALLTAGLLLLARLLKLGFLADFLSRTVLIGFLTGVGFQVGIAVLNEMLKVEVHGSNPVGQLLQIVRQLPQANIPTLCLSAGVVALVLLLHRFARRFWPSSAQLRQAQHLISQDMASRWSAPSQGGCLSLIFRFLR